MKKSIVCIDLQDNKHKVPIDKLSWRPAAYGIIIKDKKILLSRQFGDKYDLPGGSINLGEEIESGVTREVKEETGIKVSNPELIDIKNCFFYNINKNKTYQSILMYYKCTYISGTPSKDGFSEGEKSYADLAEWIPLEDIDNIKLASTVNFIPFIKKALTLE